MPGCTLRTMLCLVLAVLMCANTVVRSESLEASAKPRNAYSRMEAEDTDYNFATSTCSTGDDLNGETLCGIDIGDHVCYYLVDFTDTQQPSGITVRVSNGFNSTGSALIYVYVKNTNAPPVTIVTVEHTGDYETYETLSSPFATPVFGRQDVCLSFSYSDVDEVNDITYTGVRLNWLQFY